MTLLRKQMLDELQRRNYSQTTVKGYLKIVEAFARYFHRSPDQLGPETSLIAPRTVSYERVTHTALADVPDLQPFR